MLILNKSDCLLFKADHKPTINLIKSLHINCLQLKTFLC